MNNDYQSVTNSLHNIDTIREQQVSRPSQQLYRYTHEPVSSNLLRRDIPPILILIFFLFLIVIIISQILVVHTSRYGNNFSTMQKIQEELKQMDESMEQILHNNVLPITKWRLLFRIQTYLYRFEYLFNLFNDRKTLPNENLNQHKLHSSVKKQSNALLNEENNFLNSVKNIKYSQNRYEQFLNDNNNDRYQSKQNKQKNDNMNNNKRRNYCNEQPSHLSMIFCKITICFI